MINELQSQNWAYLLDPCFQLVSTKGAPLTGGHLEVFYNGTRTPYYCASDFNGTLHPFKIPLDSLGSNVVLADPKFSYDVYVYNRFGVLQMSRYNVHPGSGSGSGSSGEGGDAAHWIGKSGATVSVPKTIATTLPLPENPDYEGDFATILNNTFTLAPGLYMVDCLVDFRQSSSDLTNKIGSIKFYTSDSSDPIEGQIFERNETGPDASGDSHQVQVSFVRHVAEVGDDDALRFEMASSNDLTYARIDRLSIVKLEQGGGGTAYAAGYGIQIDGQVISTSGMMPEASAANFVDNSTYQVDIQNIYETIAETSAMIPSGVATEQYVQDFTSAFITEDALDGYATQDWVEDQHYITSADIPDIPEDVITSGELATVSGDIVAQIPSLDGYATEQWVVEQGYLTSADLPESVPLVAGEGISIVDTSASTIISVDSAYSPGVSEEWVEEYVSDATSAFITSADIPDIPEDLVTSGDLATVSGDIVSQIPDVSDMATQTWVSQQGYLTSVPDEYVTSGELATVSGDIMSQMPSQTSVAIEPTLQTGTKIADYVIDGTSGELYAPEGGGSTYNGIKPISIQGSDISLTYGETLTCPDPDPIQCQYRMGKDGDYAYFNNGSYDIEPTNSCDIVFPSDTTVVGGTPGDTLRLRLTDEINSLYINGTVNLVSNGSTVYLRGGSDTFYLRSSVMRPSGRTWADMFDFSQYSLSDIEGDIRIELWEFNGDTPVQHLRMSYNELLIYTNAVPSYLNVTYPVPSPTYNQGYVLTENGDGTYSWSAPTSGGGGSIEYPLVYSASDFNDPMTSAYAENSSHKYYTTESPLGLTATSIRKSDNSLYAGGLYSDHLNFNVDGEDYTVSPSDIEHWNNTYNAVDTSAAYWNSAYNAINDSASYWNDAAGMNEYPISAGPGMSITDVSGVTVFGPDVPYLTQAVGADETVIYNGKLPNLNGNLTLSESWNNFKQIRVRGGENTPEDHYYSSVSRSKAAFKISWAYNWMNEAYLKFSATSDPKVWTYAANTYVHYTHTDTSVFVTQNDTVTLGSACNFKVVGIGRISGGN